MARFSMGAGLKVALVALATAPAAWSFCGFYVAQEPGSLFNQSSKVVLVRDGDRTVMTMANDYKGDPREFGLVIPVPQVIEPGMVKVADPAVIARLDQYTVPRLAEYYDPDPCPEPYPMVDDRHMGFPSMAAPAREESAKVATRRSLGVTVEQQYDLEEYSITVIKATTGRDLETWLTREGYQIPPGAAPILDSYIKQKMHFFLAKINLAAKDQLGVAWPRPLRVEYESPKFMLPIRLGTVNADGPQDLVVLALTARGRVETTNYRTGRMPTDISVPVHVSKDFSGFYTTVFDRQVWRDGMSAAWLEYAWPLTVSCDPCSAEQLSAAELQNVGASWATDYHGGVDGGFVTRLHVRYDRDHFPEDLVFQETADNAPWQVRYTINHPFTGDTSCAAGREYERALRERQETEVGNLARLTGWDPDEIRSKVK